MKSQKEKSSFILVRNLSKKDNAVLKSLRAEFGTEYNTVAVMRAAYGYAEQANIIKNQKLELIRLAREAKALATNLDKLKGSVKKYFDFQKGKVIKEKGLIMAMGKVVGSKSRARESR